MSTELADVDSKNDDSVYGTIDYDAMLSTGVDADVEDDLNGAVVSLFHSASTSDCETPEKVLLPTKRARDGKVKSWVWEYFQRNDNDSIYCLCRLCNLKVNYSAAKSTGALSRHLKKAHKSVWEKRLCEKTELSLSSSVATISSSTTSSIRPFINNFPDFEKCVTRWMIETYQPLRCVEDKYFRAMCQSLNFKAPILTRDKLKTLISEQYHCAKLKLKNILNGKYFTFTTDGWASLNKKAYITGTVHFIDCSTWTLHAVVMGLYEKHGGSKHEDIVNYCEQQFTQFELPYSKAIAVVTDTEATMVAAGRLFVSNSITQGGRTKWIGCIDHLVQLCTKLAFKGNVFLFFFLCLQF